MSRKKQFPLGAAVTIDDLAQNLHPVMHRLRAAEPVSRAGREAFAKLKATLLPTLRRDRDSSLLAAIVEESLRLEPAASVVDRYAVHEVQLGEARIQTDDLVRVILSAANRDPKIFARPDLFDPSRSNLKSHVTFAQGPHVCLGLHSARPEAQLALERLLVRLPDLRLYHRFGVELAEPGRLVFRKPQAVNVVWNRP